MSYESPIDAIISDVITTQEELLVKAVQSVGFNINKKELEKALSYDRGQYDKGYADAQKELLRCKDCIHCTYDGDQLLYFCDYTPFDNYIQVMPLDYCSWGERRKEVSLNPNLIPEEKWEITGIYGTKNE